MAARLRAPDHRGNGSSRELASTRQSRLTFDYSGSTQTLDALLKAEVERRYREKWLKENQRSIATYNERVARDGVFGDDLRDF